MINRNVPSVIVPVDPEGWGAIYDLREDDFDYLVFPINEEHITMLFGKNFFDLINEKLDVWIDAYEEAVIADPLKINRLIAYLSSTEFRDRIHAIGEINDNSIADYYADKIILMAKKALRLQTPILFHF